MREGGREVVLHVAGIGRSPGIDDSCGRWEVSVDAAFGAAWELAPVHFYTDNYSGYNNIAKAKRCKRRVSYYQMSISMLL
jgi:hypothetical protein